MLAVRGPRNCKAIRLRAPLRMPRPHESGAPSALWREWLRRGHTQCERRDSTVRNDGNSYWVTATTKLVSWSIALFCGFVAFPNSVSLAQDAVRVEPDRLSYTTKVDDGDLWAEILEETKVRDVYVSPSGRQVAILEGPGKPSREFASWPSIVFEMPAWIARLNVLDFEHRGVRWGRNLTISEVGTGRVRQVPIPEGSWVGKVSWSPKGAWVSFVVLTGSRSELWVASSRTGISYLASDVEIELSISGQKHASLRSLSVENVPYAWLADESGIVFGQKSSPRKLTLSERVGIRPPRTSDSRIDTHWHPRTTYAGFAKTMIREMVISGSFTNRIVLASLIPDKPSEVFSHQEQFTHISTLSGSHEASLASISVDGAGEYTRRLQILDLASNKKEQMNSVAVPANATWELIPTGSESSIVRVRANGTKQECLVRLDPRQADRTAQYCFEESVSDIADVGESILILQVQGTITRLSKDRLRATGQIMLQPSQNTVYKFLKYPSSFCNGIGSTYVVSKRSSVGQWSADRGGSGVATSRLFRLDFDESELYFVLDLTNSESIEGFTGFLNCTSEPIVAVESKEQPANYFVLDPFSKSMQSLTAFASSIPDINTMRHVRIDAMRSDGVPISADIIFPANQERAHLGKLPVIFWTYPTRHKTLEEWLTLHSEGGVFARHKYPNKSSAYRDPRLDSYIGAWLPNLLAYDGYVVVAYPDFPLIGTDGKSDYGSFIVQQALNAKTLIERMGEIDEVDLSRIAIGGHSRGGSVAALLLARTDLFAAGISISGPSNYLLNPNTIQFDEERSYWQYSQGFIENSSILVANQINEPLLILHGEDDDFPTYIESLQLHRTLFEQGRTSRLVVYPDEGHVPMYAETQLHMLREVSSWLDNYLGTAGDSND